MVKKYVRVLESRELNPNTGEVWAIQDVPNTWRSKTEQKILSDGYYIAEDGTVYPEPEKTVTKKRTTKKTEEV